MTRTGKIFSWTFATLVLLLAVLVLIIVFFDWNRIKPPLNAKVSEELHRPFAINGNLAVIWQSRVGRRRLACLGAVAAHVG
jgi:uncharacterized protein involved in outer membrane biogenesis